MVQINKELWLSPCGTVRVQKIGGSWIVGKQLEGSQWFESIESWGITSCKTSAEVLAHQSRGRETFIVCLDCADRFYQDQLTRQLIANEKVSA